MFSYESTTKSSCFHDSTDLLDKYHLDEGESPQTLLITGLVVVLVLVAFSKSFQKCPKVFINPCADPAAEGAKVELSGTWVENSSQGQGLNCTLCEFWVDGICGRSEIKLSYEMPYFNTQNTVNQPLVWDTSTKVWQPSYVLVYESTLLQHCWLVYPHQCVNSVPN